MPILSTPSAELDRHKWVAIILRISAVPGSNRPIDQVTGYSLRQKRFKQML